MPGISEPDGIRGDASAAETTHTREGEPAEWPATWYAHLDDFDAAVHVATRLESLMWGIDSASAQEECESAAAIWMRDLREIARARFERLGRSGLEG